MDSSNGPQKSGSQFQARPVSSKNSMGWMGGLVVIILIVVIGGGVWMMRSGNGFGETTPDYNKDAYHAVFLSNGQVYFGKLEQNTTEFVTLKDIYYLQLNQENLNQSARTSDKTDEKPEVQLVKLGNELHGPQDEMSINQDHVLFVEELKEDSQVVNVINNSK